MIGTMSKVPLLKGLGNAQLRKVVQAMELVLWEPGAPIFRQGEAGNNFYIVASGRLRVFITLDHGTEKELTTLGEADYFGEQALGPGVVTRTASVSAVEKSSCYVLKKEHYQRIVWPVIRQGLLQTVKRVPLLQTLGPKEKEMLILGMCLRTFPHETRIIGEGEVGTEFFILQSGRVRVLTGHGTETEEQLAILEEGTYFGERALVKKEKRNATIIAEGDCICYTLSEDQFCQILLPHAQGALQKQEAIRGLLQLMEEDSDDEGDPPATE